MANEIIKLIFADNVKNQLKPSVCKTFVQFVDNKKFIYLYFNHQMA